MWDVCVCFASPQKKLQKITKKTHTQHTHTLQKKMSLTVDKNVIPTRKKDGQIHVNIFLMTIRDQSGTDHKKYARPASYTRNLRFKKKCRALKAKGIKKPWKRGSGRNIWAHPQMILDIAEWANCKVAKDAVNAWQALAKKT